MSTPNLPDEMDPFTMYLGIVDALQNGTALRSVDTMLGDRTTPSTNLHRHFRIDPGKGGFTGRGRPGDNIVITQTVRVVLHHDYVPNSHVPSFMLAAQDWRAAVRALMTRTELARLATPLGREWEWKLVGHTIETTITLDCKFHFSLPDSAGPGT